MQTQTSPDPLADELRRRLDAQWAGQPADRDRLLRLVGLADDPYAQVTLRRLTLLERLYVVCDQQMEAGSWNAAFRTITTIDRWERRASPPAVAAAEPEPPSDRHRDLARAKFEMLLKRQAGIPASAPAPEVEPLPPLPELARALGVRLPFT